MTKNEFFDKFNIDQTHSEWNDVIDNWNGVEIYRIMHDGQLSNSNDSSFKYLLEFSLNCANLTEKWVKNVVSRPDFGSLYLTSKRLMYRYADYIIDEMG